VPVERQLRLRHAAERDEALGLESLLDVGVHLDAGSLLDRRRRLLALEGLLDCGALAPHLRVVQGHRDDDAVTRAHPKAVVGHQKGCDANKAESELAGACAKIRKCK
jgi:hypothetical protein